MPRKSREPEGQTTSLREHFRALWIISLAVILGLAYANLIIFLFHTGIVYSPFWLLWLGFLYGCLGVKVANPLAGLHGQSA